ncbi:hypothetical protein GCM10011369_11690 [Neiella marina]|uniref:Uncharacterized protein n=1 Tax=Neiella marina TaxID=508461 RepID=A0A8J2U3W0_9GAMM|nr:hypothetical protein [Neiella marina]GGA71581.1 hypothetical protein GCM10011369_11690 [Neiella marina]
MALKLGRHISQLTAIITFSWSSACVAGCGEGTEQCLVLTEQAEHYQSCQVRVCANANEYSSEWKVIGGGTVSVYRGAEEQRLLVDGKPGLELPYSVLQEGLSCFGTAKLEKVYCTKDVSY